MRLPATPRGPFVFPSGLASRVPALDVRGRPVRVQIVPELRDRRGPVHGGAFVRERKIVLEAGLLRHPADFARIFVHEGFHFVWVSLGNPARRSWEELLSGELRGAARGELGWSAQWRKAALKPGDVWLRTRRWREYACESFCDTAAWLYAGLRSHREWTLAGRRRDARRGWFERWGINRRSI